MPPKISSVEALMPNALRIYLSGSIKKGRADNRSGISFWSDSEEATIRRHIGADVVLLNPAKTSIRRQDYRANFGCDLHLVTRSDVLLVDLREERGIGVGAEMMFARYVDKPVVGWIPKNSYYRRDRIEDLYGEDLTDWIHPFAYGLCDHVADDLRMACDQILELSLGQHWSKDDDKSPDVAVSYFIAKYPMYRDV
jgi:hypothetical protein